MYTANQNLTNSSFLKRRLDELACFLKRFLPLLLIYLVSFSNSTFGQTQVISPSSACGCGTKPSCEFTGPAKACPGSSNTYCVKKSIPYGYTYNWSVSGKGSIVGSCNNKCVTIKADKCCDGKYKVKLTIKKHNTIISECWKEIWVGDKEKPTITKGWIEECYKTKSAAEAAAIKATKYSDNCTEKKDLKITASTYGECSACITVTVTDKCGNSCSVKYYTRIDNTPPKVTAGWIEKCYKTKADAEAAAIAATTATDNCPGDLYKYASTYGDCYACITVIVYDKCGNSCAVKYYTRIDGTPPIVYTHDIEKCYKTKADAEAAAIAASSAHDNCTLTNKLTITASTEGDCSAVITVTVTDECYNSTKVTYYTRIDNTPPDPVYVHPIAECYKTVEEAQAAAIKATSAFDNCTATDKLTLTASTYGDCSAVITVTVADECHNSTQVTYNTRIDHTAPDLSGCPSNETYDCYQNVPDHVTVTAHDNCDGVVDVTYTETQSNPYHPSCDNTITRTWSATDHCGNTSSCTQTIYVNDNVPPVFHNVPPAEVTLERCGQDFDHHDPIAEDNCGGNVTVTGPVDYQEVPCGDATKTWTATDECGNQSTYVQTIHIPGLPGSTIASRPISKSSDVKKSAVDKLSVIAYPTPYQHELNFKFVSPVSGKALLEVYNELGQKMGVAFNGDVTAGISRTVNYKVPAAQRVTLMYRLSVGNLHFTGSAIPNK